MHDVSTNPIPTLLSLSIPGLDKVTAVIGTHDETSKEVTSLQIETLPLDAIDCDLMVEELCFWTSVKYRLKENRQRTVLGTLSNPYLVGMCPDYVLNYTMKRGEFSGFTIGIERFKLRTGSR